LSVVVVVVLLLLLLVLLALVLLSLSSSLLLLSLLLRLEVLTSPLVRLDTSVPLLDACAVGVAVADLCTRCRPAYDTCSTMTRIDM
jgi:hypothetical protein